LHDIRGTPRYVICQNNYSGDFILFKLREHP